jgi:ubiquinone/menaquinone biosynthesis C-methylase UbiE
MGNHGHDRGHDHAGGHGHGGGTARDRHGNPEDFDAYLAKLDDPERATWQKPDEVVAALGLRPGDVACDVGVGPGHFALRMARAVGPAGRVHAVDVDPRMIALLERRAREERISNVRPLLVPDGVPLPPEPCDVVLLVNVFHHLADGPGTLRALGTRLRPGGRIVNVDFHQGELPVGPPPDQKVSREEFLGAARRAGLSVEREETLLPHQYLVVLRPA